MSLVIKGGLDSTSRWSTLTGCLQAPQWVLSIYRATPADSVTRGLDRVADAAAEGKLHFPGFRPFASE